MNKLIFNSVRFYSNNNEKRRVVVTGLGCLSPLSSKISGNWEKLLNKETGAKKIENENFEQIPSKIAFFLSNEVDLKKNFSNSELKTLSKNTLCTLLAGKNALEDSMINFEKVDLTRFGTAVGTGMVDLNELSEHILTFKEKGYKKLNPYFITKILLNMPAGYLSIKYGLKGPNHTVTTACTTGAHSIGDSFNFIRYNSADIMICGGSEYSINPISLASFARIRALATKFNESPEKASRPFDKERNGFVMGEGTGLLILEELKHAKKRNAKIYAEVLGYGLSADASHITSPSENGLGAYNSMKNAIKDSNINIKDVSLINCHATSTPLGDEIELKAIKELFKKDDHYRNIFITSNKGSIGHLLGAAGAVESIFTILSCYYGLIPPTVNLENSIEPELKIVKDSNFSWNLNKHFSKKVALKNSFGFGGTNASLIFSEFRD